MLSTFHHAFKEQFCRAAIAMIADTAYHEVFARFLVAYEYRRQFSWLEEHQPHRKNQSGLAAALQIALATYIVSRRVISAEATTSLISLSEQDGKPGIDAEQVNELKLAVAATIEESFCLERFEQRLVRAVVDVETIVPDALQRHIAAALDNYYDQREAGLSPDPF